MRVEVVKHQNCLSFAFELQVYRLCQVVCVGVKVLSRKLESQLRRTAEVRYYSYNIFVLELVFV